jgi:ribosomal protein L29
MTEPERHELYELAKHHVNDRYAELMIKALPPDPANLATKDDVGILGNQLRTEIADLGAELRTEMADLRTELRTEMGGLRTELAELRTELRTGLADVRVEMRDLTSQQTRSMTLALVGSITLLTITQLVVAAFGG